MIRYFTILIFTFTSCAAYAQTDSTIPLKKMKPTPPWWVQRFRVSAGLFVPVNNTIIEVGDVNGNHGTTIDFQKDLGFTKSTTTFLGAAQWRASRRSKFELDYYHINRKSTHTLQKDIQFEDSIYPVNASVKAFFNTDIYQFSYGYAFFLNPKYEAGLAIGAHVVGGSVGIGLNSGAGSIDAQTDFNFTAPLPDFGVWGGYAINNKWAFNGAFNYLSLTVGNIKGRIISYNAIVNYSIMKNLSASIGYTGLNFKVNMTKDKFQGYFKWGYNGPALTVNYAFGRNSWH